MTTATAVPDQHPQSGTEPLYHDVPRPLVQRRTKPTHPPLVRPDLPKHLPVPTCTNYPWYTPPPCTSRNPWYSQFTREHAGHRLYHLYPYYVGGGVNHNAHHHLRPVGPAARGSIGAPR